MSAAQVKEMVVMVHGLRMPGWVMALLALRLRRCGFDTRVFSYPSVRTSLAENALQLSRFVARIAAPRIHFVGHSLGGLLVLQMLALSRATHWPRGPGGQPLSWLCRGQQARAQRDGAAANWAHSGAMARPAGTGVH